MLLLLSSSPTNAKKGSGDCRAVVCEKVTTFTHKLSPLTPDDWWQMDLYKWRSPGRAEEIAPAKVTSNPFSPGWTLFEQTWKVDFLRAHSNQLEINYDDNSVKPVPLNWTASLYYGRYGGYGHAYYHSDITIRPENCHLRTKIEGHDSDPFVPC